MIEGDIKVYDHITEWNPQLRLNEIDTIRIRLVDCQQDGYWELTSTGLGTAWASYEHRLFEKPGFEHRKETAIGVTAFAMFQNLVLMAVARQSHLRGRR